MKKVKRILSLVMTVCMLVSCIVISTQPTTLALTEGGFCKAAIEGGTIDKSTSSTITVKAVYSWTSSAYLYNAWRTIYPTDYRAVCNGATASHGDPAMNGSAAAVDYSFNVSGWALGSYTVSAYITVGVAGFESSVNETIHDDNTITVTCSHSGGRTGSQTCTTAQYCSVCGAVTAPALGHDYSSTSTDSSHLKSAATCTAAAVYYKSCSRCGANSSETFTSGDALGHNPGAAATCTTAQTCTRCGTTLANALGHDYSVQSTDSSHLKSAATCTASAVYYKSCSRCAANGTETFTSGDPLGHSWDSGVQDTAPTPDTMGKTKYTCTRCGATRIEVDIPVLTGIDVLIYYADQVIAQHNNGQLFTSKEGFDSAWSNFMSAYNGAVAARGGSEEDIEAAGNELVYQMINLRYYQPLDTTELQAAIAQTPAYAEQYYVADTYSAWTTARTNAQTFLYDASTGTKALADEAEMDNVIFALNAAYNGITLKSADYTALNAARNLEKVRNVDLYIDSVADPVRAILAEINDDLTILDQATVDNWTTTLLAAAEALTTETLDYADYTQVDAAIAIANALTSTNYTNYAAVTAAINAVDRTILRGQQDLVDEMAKAINDAIDALTPARANYTALDAIVAEADALDDTLYSNFAAVQNIIDSIDWNIDIFHQSEVDDYVTAIREKLGDLQYADADYSGVYAAIDRIDTLGNLDDFIDESVDALNDAMAAVVPNLTKENNGQARVDEMAQAINDAIDSMQLKLADYTEVENALADVPGEEEADNYTNYSVMEEAINAINWNIDIRHQSDVHTTAASIIAAKQSLIEKPADYTAVDNKIAEIEDMIENPPLYEYDEDSVAAYHAYINNLPRNLTISHQDEVDDLVIAVQTAAETILKYVPADYTAVYAAIESANEIDRDLYEDLTEVDSAVREVEYDLTIDRQDEVNAMAARINNAVANIVMLSADYSVLDMNLRQYQEINRDYYSAEDMAYVDAIVENNVVRGLKKDQQDQVDAMADAIYQAIRYLDGKMLYADLTQLNAATASALAKIEVMEAQGYEIVPELLARVYRLIDDAESMEGAHVDAQEDIDALTQSLIQAANDLEFVFTITDDTTALFDEGFVYGFEEGVTANDITSMISFVGTANVEIIETANGLGTGSQVVYKDAQGNVLDEFTLVIYGDANGDGWIDMFDVSIVSEIANSGAELDDCVNEALDVNNDGFIDAFDVALMISLANMEVSISQDGSFNIA